MKMLIIVASIILILHGLVHLMGTAAYLKLAELKGLPYKTTVLGGRWDGNKWHSHLWRAVGAGCHRIRSCRSSVDRGLGFW